MLGRLADAYIDWRVNVFRAKSRKRIQQYGWTANYVGDERAGQLDFAYSIGFSDYGAPELLVFNLEPIWVNHVFWEMFERVKAGRPPLHGERYVCPEPDTGGFEVTFLEAEHPDIWDKYVFDAMAYDREQGRSGKPAVMQMVWPSSETFQYPWDEDCPRTVSDHQPPLWTAPPLNG